MGPLDQDERISAYLDGELPADQQTRFEEELSRSGDLRQLVEELRAVRESMQALPQHRLEHDFAERVLRRAERLMLTGQPIRAAADPQPAPAEKVSPAPARELAPSHTSRRHFQSWRPWVWSALALSVAAVIVGIERWEAKDRRVAVVAPSGKDRSEKDVRSLPVGEIVADDHSAARPAGNGQNAVADRRLTEDHMRSDKQDSDNAPRVATDKSAALSKQAATQSPAPLPLEGALAKKSPDAASANGASPVPPAGAPGEPLAGPADESPAAETKGTAAARPFSSLAEEAQRSKPAPASAPADQPVATPLAADGRASRSVGGAADLADSRAELQRRAGKVPASDARDFDHELVVVECNSAADVPRQAFPRLLARHGIAFYEAAPSSTTYSAPGADSSGGRANLAELPAAADAPAPATSPAATAPAASAPAGSAGPPAVPVVAAPVAKEAAQPSAVAGAAAKPPAAALAIDAVTPESVEQRKALEVTVDRLRAAAAPGDNVTMFYVEGTPEQVLGLVSELRQQPIVYRSLAVHGAAAELPQEERAAKAIEKRADRKEPATTGLADVTQGAQQLVTSGRQRPAAWPEGAWAVELYERSGSGAEQLKDIVHENRRDAAKSDDQVRQLDVAKTEAPGLRSSGLKPGREADRGRPADDPGQDADKAAANGVSKPDSSSNKGGMAAGGGVPGSATPSGSPAGSAGKSTPAKGAPGFRFSAPGSGAGDGARGFDKTKGGVPVANGGPQQESLDEAQRDQAPVPLNQPSAPPQARKPEAKGRGAPQLDRSIADEGSPAAAEDAKTRKPAEEFPTKPNVQFGNSAKDHFKDAEDLTDDGPRSGGEAGMAGLPTRDRGEPQRMRAVILFRLAPVAGK